MSASTGLVPVSPLDHGSLPVARMRSLYRVDEVVKTLDKLPQQSKVPQSLRPSQSIAFAPHRSSQNPSAFPAQSRSATILLPSTLAPESPPPAQGLPPASS